MTNRPSVSIIIPARNEGANLASTIRSVQDLGQVIVVDDCSTDDTSVVARDLGAEVIRRHHHPGKGQSLTLGVGSAQGSIVVFLDADLGKSSREIEKLVEVVACGQADLAVACIEQVGSPGLGLVTRLSRYVLAKMGVVVKQPLCGQRALNRLALQEVVPFAEGWGVEVAMLVRAARRGLVIREVPTNMYHAGTGRSLRGFWHRARQGMQIAATLGRLALKPWE